MSEHVKFFTPVDKPILKSHQFLVMPSKFIKSQTIDTLFYIIINFHIITIYKYYNQ